MNCKDELDGVGFS